MPTTVEREYWATHVVRLKVVEEYAIREALRRTYNNRTHAAALLGISVRTLQRKLKNYAANGRRWAEPPPPY